MTSALTSALAVSGEPGVPAGGLSQERVTASVHGWINRGGSELGAIRYDLKAEDLPGIANTIKQWDIRGLIAVGKNLRAVAELQTRPLIDSERRTYALLERVGFDPGDRVALNPGAGRPVRREILHGQEPK